ncbi:MAG TPA: hypothetical protein VGX28_14785 [Frankiaceae bacterium]|jgi:uncharacterized membrane protein YeaQ/YmgE (transglycosylase-associated protein family)|nr:hypothetical protein [Frankiaceae bacterium]
MIEETLVADVRLMTAHALETGRPVHPSWLDAARLDGSEPDAVRRLGRAHDGLSALVAPATPRSLRYLAESGGSRRRLPIVRWLAILAMTFLAGFVALELDPDVGSKAADFETGSGSELLMNMLFQLCAAGLGASFAALFAVNARLRDYSLEPREEFAALVRIMLGLVAGLVLAQLAPFDSDGRTFGRPLLALLGGFSVDVVYQMLRRLVDLASSIVAPVGDTAEAARATADAREAQLKVGVAQRLVRLRSRLDGDAAAEVDALIAELSPTDDVPAAADPPAPPAGPDPTPTAPVRRRAPA